ncbi:Uncharacterised protein [Turicibacter sanguinis]|nr:Uncharacterised protein [Turicibacter sanguinis]
MKKTLIILVLIIIISSILAFLNYYSALPQTNCTNPDNSYIIYNSFYNENPRIECSKLDVIKDKPLNYENLLNVVNLKDNIIFYGTDSILEVNKLTGEFNEFDKTNEEGIIQKVVEWDTNQIYLVNGAFTEEGYYSYMIVNDVKVVSQGGLMVSAIRRNEYIYVTERNVPSSHRTLYKYNLNGELIKTFNEDEVFGDINPILDMDNNIIFMNNNKLILINENDKITVSELDTEKEIIGESSLFTLGSKIYGVSSNGIIFEIKNDEKIIEYKNTIPIGSDGIYSEPEMVYNCYSTTDEKIICQYNSIEDMVTVSAFVEYDPIDNSISIHMPFSFDTNENYYPAHLIKVGEND